MSEDSGRVVRIERTFAASAEDVFDAWTSPEVMQRWFHCGYDWTTPEADVDLRLGGEGELDQLLVGGIVLEGPCHHQSVRTIDQRVGANSLELIEAPLPSLILAVAAFVGGDPAVDHLHSSGHLIEDAASHRALSSPRGTTASTRQLQGLLVGGRDRLS